VKPWHVLLVWVPFVAYLLWRAATNPLLPAGALVGAFLGGIAFWTLLEYVLHRWVFHFEPSPDSELSQDVMFLIHGVHHDFPHDPDRLVMPPVLSIVLAVVLGYPIHWILGPVLFAPAFAGLVTGYLWYDMTHYAVHHLRQRTEMGNRLRKHHYLHHFKTPDARYGVSTPLWDYVFGTQGVAE
jgi:sterol desaturase/sphingolipid hydroxylase (fatty acid hydroxylase superfamily)